MAGCYKQLGKKPEAIKCYQRAESNNDREGIALHKRILNPNPNPNPKPKPKPEPNPKPNQASP